MNIVKQTISFRNNNQVRRNDFIQLLLELKNQKHQENTIELTDELIAAQVANIFFSYTLCHTYKVFGCKSLIIIFSSSRNKWIRKTEYFLVDYDRVFQTLKILTYYHLKIVSF